MVCGASAALSQGAATCMESRRYFYSTYPDVIYPFALTVQGNGITYLA